jgi:hypothetical protein
MFLQAANPNSEGKTRLWLYSELEVLYPGVEFQTNNGGDWNRSDGVLKDYIIHREKRGVKCIGIRLDGHKDTSIEKRIKPSISKAIKNQRCKVLDVGGKNIECDHKDGRYTPETYGNIEDQNSDDFQALHRNVNLAKRTHCTGCKITGKRYNAFGVDHYFLMYPDMEFHQDGTREFKDRREEHYKILDLLLKHNKSNIKITISIK